MPAQLTALDGLVNFRDLGGLPAEGGRIRSGVLYRSESLSNLTPAGREALSTSGIEVVVDMRGVQEAAHAPGLAADSETPRLVALPMLDGAVPATLTELPTLENVYAALVQNHGQDFARIAGLVAEADGGVLIHCTAGKDRTGIATALLLLAAGAELDAVREDYLASAGNLAGAWAEGLFAQIRAQGIDVPDTPEVRELLHGTSGPAFDAAIEWVVAEHGGAAEYLVEHGLEEGQLRNLRARLSEACDAGSA